MALLSLNYYCQQKMLKPVHGDLHTKYICDQICQKRFYTRNYKHLEILI